MPLRIISDRDPLFTSEFWQDFFERLTIILNMSTARSPWSDGKSERYIRTVVEQLRIFCRDNPTDWDLYVGAVEFAINDTVDPVRGYSPFQLNQLTVPHTPISLAMQAFKSSLPSLPKTADPDVLDSTRYSEIMDKVKNSFFKIQQTRKQYLERRGLVLGTYAKGDKVYIEAPQADRNWKNLGPLEDRYIGPFTLGDEVRTNKFIIQEWKNSTTRYPVVDARKFKRVSQPLVDSDISPPKPSFEEYMKNMPVNPHPPTAAPQSAPVTIVPKCTFELSILPITQVGEPNDPDKLNYDHTTYGVRVIRKTETSSQIQNKPPVVH